MNLITRRIRLILAMVTTLTYLALWSLQSVAAHEGHAHADEGLDISTSLGVAGTIVVLGIAYVIASRVYRFRDDSRGRDVDGHDANIGG